jgi:hypothetical protein
MSTVNDQAFLSEQLALELGCDVCARCDVLFNPADTPVPALCCRCWLAESDEVTE